MYYGGKRGGADNLDSLLKQHSPVLSNERRHVSGTRPTRLGQVARRSSLDCRRASGKALSCKRAFLFPRFELRDCLSRSINFAALEHAHHKHTLTHSLLVTGHSIRPIESCPAFIRLFPAGFLSPHITARTQHSTANTAKSITHQQQHVSQLRRSKHAQLGRCSWRLALWRCRRQQQSTAEQAAVWRRGHTYFRRRTLWRCQHNSCDRWWSLRRRCS